MGEGEAKGCDGRKGLEREASGAAAGSFVRTERRVGMHAFLMINDGNQIPSRVAKCISCK